MIVFNYSDIAMSSKKKLSISDEPDPRLTSPAVDSQQQFLYMLQNSDGNNFAVIRSRLNFDSPNIDSDRNAAGSRFQSNAYGSASSGYDRTNYVHLTNGPSHQAVTVMGNNSDGLNQSGGWLNRIDNDNTQPNVDCRNRVSTTDIGSSKPIMKPPKKRKNTDIETDPYLQNNATAVANEKSIPDNQLIQPVQTMAKAAAVNLAEWRGHRVLAKKGNHYFPGVIKTILNNNDVGVMFDSDQEVRYFSSTSRSVDIISDNAPPAMSILVGMQVCIRNSSDLGEFSVGKVTEKVSQPPSYVVLLENSSQASGGVHAESVKVSRANLRLLQAPWFEDLEEPEIASITSMVNNPSMMPLKDAKESKEDVRDKSSSFESGLSTPSSGYDNPRK